MLNAIWDLACLTDTMCIYTEKNTNSMAPHCPQQYSKAPLPFYLFKIYWISIKDAHNLYLIKYFRAWKTEKKYISKKMDMEYFFFFFFFLLINLHCIPRYGNLTFTIRLHLISRFDISSFIQQLFLVLKSDWLRGISSCVLFHKY